MRKIGGLTPAVRLSVCKCDAILSEVSAVAGHTFRVGCGLHRRRGNGAGAAAKLACECDNLTESSCKHPARYFMVKSAEGVGSRFRRKCLPGGTSLPENDSRPRSLHGRPSVRVILTQERAPLSQGCQTESTDSGVASANWPNEAAGSAHQGVVIFASLEPGFAGYSNARTVR